MSAILLLGKDGQLGRELRRALLPLGGVVACGRAECDIGDPDAVRRTVEALRPRLIVNAAAYTAVDRAEEEAALAMRINGEAPGWLAEAAREHHALLVHYSSDYVFDGARDGAYAEGDVPAPVNAYGASKLAGERAVQASGCRHLILRTSWVYAAHGGNFLNTMLHAAAERDALRVVADQVGAPTPAWLIADVTAHLARTANGSTDRYDTPTGLYHLATAGETSWHGYAEYAVAAAARRGWPVRAKTIEAIASTDWSTSERRPARRPVSSRLDCTRLRSTFRLALPDWRTGIDLTLDQLLAQKSAP